MARAALLNALTAERDLMLALGRMLETADAEPLPSGRVALIVCGCLFDALLGALDEVETDGGREPENEHYDEAEYAGGTGPAFQIDQRVQWLAGATRIEA